MRKFNKTQRNYVIIGLCAVLVIMAVGYAAFASQLRISGTSNIGSNFLVKITNIAVSEKIGSASDKTDITTYNDTSATFGVSLVSPGDSITYDITIANQGTMDAVLKLITKTDTNNSAILFETSGVYEGDELKAGETATMKVKVTYNSAVTSQPDNLESNLNLSLDYEQTDGSVTPPSTVTTTVGGKEVPVVSSGDGLYADEYEPGKYTYKGANPNNYITFNNETWRIISVDSDGTIKIMRNENLNTVVIWGELIESTTDDWSNSMINDDLNEKYLPTITTNTDKIEAHDFDIGYISKDNNDLITQIIAEKEKTWNGKVAAITVSEYLRANINKEQCETYSLHNTNNETCITTNWMYEPLTNNGGHAWTITGSSVRAYVIVSKTLNSDASIGTAGVESPYSALPVLNLTSSTILDGNGSASNPYVITN